MFTQGGVEVGRRGHVSMISEVAQMLQAVAPLRIAMRMNTDN
jgi:hypothetical protein